MKIKGFKAFNRDLTSMNCFQFEVGKTYCHNGPVAICQSGFHFCQDLIDLDKYYSFSNDIRVCEVEASRQIYHLGNKSVCSELKIIRELPFEEWTEVVLGRADPFTKLNLLKNSNITEKIVKSCLLSDDAFIRCEAIKKGEAFLSEDILTELFKDTNIYIREMVVRCNKVTLEILNKALLDESEIVSYAAKQEKRRRFSEDY